MTHSKAVVLRFFQLFLVLIVVSTFSAVFFEFQTALAQTPPTDSGEMPDDDQDDGDQMMCVSGSAPSPTESDVGCPESDRYSCERFVCIDPTSGYCKNGPISESNCPVTMDDPCYVPACVEGTGCTMLFDSNIPGCDGGGGGAAGANVGVAADVQEEDPDFVFGLEILADRNYDGEVVEEEDRAVKGLTYFASGVYTHINADHFYTGPVTNPSHRGWVNPPANLLELPKFVVSFPQCNYRNEFYNFTHYGLIFPWKVNVYDAAGVFYSHGQPIPCQASGTTKTFYVETKNTGPADGLDIFGREYRDSIQVIMIDINEGQSLAFWLFEGIANPSVLYDGAFEKARGVELLTTVGVDLDVDSDNSNGLTGVPNEDPSHPDYMRGRPDRTPEEDYMEYYASSVTAPNALRKLISANIDQDGLWDVDGDGFLEPKPIIGFADGYDRIYDVGWFEMDNHNPLEDDFIPIEVEVSESAIANPTGLPEYRAQFRFVYAASDPKNVLVDTTNLVPVYYLSDAAQTGDDTPRLFRLWARPGSEERSMYDFDESDNPEIDDGDFFSANKSYLLENLDLDISRTLWLESVGYTLPTNSEFGDQPKLNHQIWLEVDPDGVGPAKFEKYFDVVTVSRIQIFWHPQASKRHPLPPLPFSPLIPMEIYNPDIAIWGPQYKTKFATYNWANRHMYSSLINSLPPHIRIEPTNQDADIRFYRPNPAFLEFPSTPLPLGMMVDSEASAGNVTISEVDGLREFTIEGTEPGNVVIRPTVNNIPLSAPPIAFRLWFDNLLQWGRVRVNIISVCHPADPTTPPTSPNDCEFIVSPGEILPTSLLNHDNPWEHWANIGFGATRVKQSVSIVNEIWKQAGIQFAFDTIPLVYTGAAIDAKQLDTGIFKFLIPKGDFDGVFNWPLEAEQYETLSVNRTAPDVVHIVIVPHIASSLSTTESLSFINFYCENVATTPVELVGNTEPCMSSDMAMLVVETGILSDDTNVIGQMWARALGDAMGLKDPWVDPVSPLPVVSVSPGASFGSNLMNHAERVFGYTSADILVQQALAAGLSPLVQHEAP